MAKKKSIPSRGSTARPLPVAKIISGGQTGVDRGALEAAIEFNIPHGGWCPRGRLAEDGRIPSQFHMQETESRQYHIRTERNVQDSDGTLILYRERLTGGTYLTQQFALRHRRPLKCIDLRQQNQPIYHSVIREWLRENNIRTLNVAGPRESSAPGIQFEAKALLSAVLFRSRTKNSQPRTTKEK